MPIYEFICLDCRKNSELLVRSFDWEGKVVCPDCGSNQLNKQLSIFSSSHSNQSDSLNENMTCSGMPNNCGRCGLDN